MKKFFISLFCLAATFICFSFPLAAADLPASCSQQEWDVLKETNQERLNEGLEPLSTFTALQSASDIRANEITILFDHQRPNGESYFSVLQNIPYGLCGENIAAGLGDAAAVVDVWMNSAGHRANILEGSFCHMAPGYATSGNAYRHYWVQLFVGQCDITDVNLYNARDAYPAKRGETIEDLGLVLELTCANHGKTYLPVIAEMCRGNLDFSSYQRAETVDIDAYGQSISVVLDPSLAYVGPFLDVPYGTWFFDAIKFVYDQNLFNGMTASAFEPDGSMTRGMLVTVLHRMEGLPESSSSAAFLDVESGSWFEAAIDWAAENGIVDGVGDGLFAPNSDVTREQIATILYRYSQAKGYDVTGSASFDSFPDADRVGAYAKDAMAWAVGEGLIVGSDGKLLPQQSATRAQVSTIIYRYCQQYGE